MFRSMERSGGTRGVTLHGGLPPEDYLFLLMNQKDRNPLGRIWNAPNTLLGLLYGTVGYGVGKVMGTDPRVFVRDGAVQFTNNPLASAGALTLGDTTTWVGDPYDPTDRVWHYEDGSPKMEGNHTFPEHEGKHRPQGDVLGPFYVPSNVLGGLYGLVRDGDWHGDSNWNERGPMSDPPRPWTGRK